MHVGVKLSEDKARVQVGRVDILADGEEVLFFGTCNNMSPTVDRIVITNARILGVAFLSGIAPYRAPLHLALETAYDAAKRTVSITTSDYEMVFRAVPQEDVQAIEELVEAARAVTLDDGLLAAVTPDDGQVRPTKDTLKAEARARQEAKSRAFQARREEERQQREVAQQERRAVGEREKQERRAAHAQAAKEREAARVATALRVGRLMTSGSIGAKSVEIYANGFVRVALFPTKNTPYLKLLGIDFSADVQKKTGLGRALAAGATQGISLLSSNVRGDVYLTVVTPSKTFKLHSDPPSPREIRDGNALAAAGRAVLESLGSQPRAGAPSPAPRAPAAATAPARRSAKDRLVEIKALHDQGLITDEEFAAKRETILNGL